MVNTAIVRWPLYAETMRWQLLKDFQCLCFLMKIDIIGILRYP